LEVLRGLAKIIQLPFSLPRRGTDEAYEWLSLGQQADLELKINQVLDGVKDAIRGRDAYFLPEGEPDSALIEGIEAAINQEKVIEIAYQALGESVPRLRQVEPHWLERRAIAVYLHGFCFLAEANRVFRLDRIHHWKFPIEKS
jgi:predicted DNA-binding transcriptional regulator YafY